MYNKELFEKICSVSCPFEELKEFVADIDKKEFDLDNPFEKYYSLKKILFAIKCYENKEIDDNYLAYWMNAYNWIIMGGFKIVSHENSITFKEWLEWEITDWIDSLSFFDSSAECYNLDDYKSSFMVLDKIYLNHSDWDREFAPTNEWEDNEDYVVVLAFNDKTKEFVKMYAKLDYRTLNVKFPIVEFDSLENKIKQLRSNGYKQLQYGVGDQV